MENMRNWQFGIVTTLIVSSITLLAKEAGTFDKAVTNYLLWFWFLALLSLWAFFTNLKWSMEFRNCHRCTSWASEKLKLIQPISGDRNKRVMDWAEKGHMCKEQAKRLLEDAAHQGYMAFSLPMRSMHVHVISVYLAVSILSAMVAVSTYGSLSLIGLQKEPVDQSIILGLIPSIVILVIALWYFRRIEHRVEQILAIRMPDGIQLRYRLKPVFYEPDKQTPNSQQENLPRKDT